MHTLKRLLFNLILFSVDTPLSVHRCRSWGVLEYLGAGTAIGIIRARTTDPLRLPIPVPVPRHASQREHPLSIYRYRDIPLKEARVIPVRDAEAGLPSGQCH